MKSNYFRSSALSLIALSLPCSVMAQPIGDLPTYLGASLSTQTIDFNYHQEDYETVDFLFGVAFNDFIALETHVGFGIDGVSKSYHNSNASASNDISVQGGLMLKASYPLLSKLKVYGVTGVHYSRLKFTGVGSFMTPGLSDYKFEKSESFTDFAYGAGLQYNWNDELGVFIEHKVLPNYEPVSEVSYDWNKTALGLVFTF